MPNMDMKRFLEILESDGGEGINALRVNSLLREREQVDLDTAVISTAKDLLSAVDDIRSAGLVRNVGLGAIISTYQKSSGFDAAAVTVDLSIAKHNEQDRIEYKSASVPVPIISAGFNIDARQLAAGRTMGTGIEVDHAVEATRVVVEAIEDIVFNGAATKTEGAVLYGYLTHPDRNTTTGSTWGTVANIEIEVLEAIAAAEADNRFGPYILYVNKNQYAQMRVRIGAGAGNDRTSHELISQMPEIKGIRRSMKLAAGTFALVDMTRATVDLAVGMDLSVLPWEERGGLVQHWKVMAAMAPRVKSDFDGRSGVVVSTGNA